MFIKSSVVSLYIKALVNTCNWYTFNESNLQYDTHTYQLWVGFEHKTAGITGKHLTILVMLKDSNKVRSNHNGHS